MKIEIEVDSVKLLREALCISQTAINESHVNWSKSINKRLGRLIEELDKHRPLGPDGKHNDRHTETCGCELPQRNMVTGEIIKSEHEPKCS